MTRHMRALRLKKFAVAAAVCVVASSSLVAMLWDRWSIGGAVRSMGLHEDPLTVGLTLAILPTYLAAIWIWFPSEARARKASMNDPETEGRLHWIAVRVVAVLCILATDAIAQSLPTHQAMAAIISGIH